MTQWFIVIEYPYDQLEQHEQAIADALSVPFVETYVVYDAVVISSNIRKIIVCYSSEAERDMVKSEIDEIVGVQEGDVAVEISGPGSAQGTQFVLLSSDDGAEIQLINEGDMIDPTQVNGCNATILASFFPEEVGSVAFDLNGEEYKVVNGSSPYYLGGTKQNGSIQQVIDIKYSGVYTVTATPYELPNKGGSMGTPMTVTFTMTESCGDSQND